MFLRFLFVFNESEIHLVLDTEMFIISLDINIRQWTVTFYKANYPCVEVTIYGHFHYINPEIQFSSVQLSYIWTPLRNQN